jgi:hypothetical protein
MRKGWRPSLEGYQRRPIDNSVGAADLVLSGPREEIEIITLACPTRGGQEATTPGFAPKVAAEQIQLLRGPKAYFTEMLSI